MQKVIEKTKAVIAWLDGKKTNIGALLAFVTWIAEHHKLIAPEMAKDGYAAATLVGAVGLSGIIHKFIGIVRGFLETLDKMP